MRKTLHTYQHNKNGFTLIEVMLTIFLLALSAMMVAAIYPTAQISRQKAVHMTFAMNLAKLEIEQKISAGYANVTPSSPITSAELNLPNSTKTITISQYAPNIRKVEVSITWDGYRMIGGSVTLATFISDHS
ncbi:MAG: type II secretion system protein [Armatimonadota bacterium]